MSRFVCRLGFGYASEEEEPPEYQPGEWRIFNPKDYYLLSTSILLVWMGERTRFCISLLGEVSDIQGGLAFDDCHWRALGTF